MPVARDGHKVEQGSGPFDSLVFAQMQVRLDRRRRIWSRTLSTGFSAFIALWKTIAISRQRNALSSSGVPVQDLDP